MLNFMDKEHIGDIFSKMLKEIKDKIIEAHGSNYTLHQQLDIELKLIIYKLAELEYRLNKLEDKE